jgi:hypothetical protein
MRCPVRVGHHTNLRYTQHGLPADIEIRRNTHPTGPSSFATSAEYHLYSSRPRSKTMALLSCRFATGCIYISKFVSLKTLKGAGDNLIHGSLSVHSCQAKAAMDLVPAGTGRRMVSRRWSPLRAVAIWTFELNVDLCPAGYSLCGLKECVKERDY